MYVPNNMTDTTYTQHCHMHVLHVHVHVHVCTFGVCPRTLPARASEPWTLPRGERNKLVNNSEPQYSRSQ